MKASTLILFIFGAFLIVSSCKKEDPPNFHYGYFGLAEGRYVVYDVMEITHDAALNQHDTLNYQMKTIWGDEYIDNEGRSGREFVRYVRNNPGAPWLISDLWYGVYDGIRGELVEENERKVKLVFAPTYQKNWDANAYNLQDELDCYYRDIHSDTTLNGVFLDSTLVVEQKFDVNAIDTAIMYEMYAKNVGMVYQHQMDNHYQFTSTEVVLGSEFYMTYNSHGWE